MEGNSQKKQVELRVKMQHTRRLKWKQGGGFWTQGVIITNHWNALKVVKKQILWGEL